MVNILLKICRGEDLRGLKTLDCYSCQQLTSIPVIKDYKNYIVLLVHN